MCFWCVIAANLFRTVKRVNSVANAKGCGCFIDTIKTWLRTFMHHDGEEIDSDMEPGDIYSSSGSASKYLCDPGKLTTLSELQLLSPSDTGVRLAQGWQTRGTHAQTATELHRRPHYSVRHSLALSLNMTSGSFLTQCFRPLLSVNRSRHGKWGLLALQD